MKNTFFLVLIFLFIIGCAGTKNAIKKSFSTEEVKLIMNGDSLKPMRVYKITSKNSSLNDDLKVMSYNVRMFNYYKWSEDTTLEKQIVDFITEKKPDILAIQEFYDSDSIKFNYPYQFIKMKSKTSKFGLAIYSKYKIIHSGSLDLKNSANNIIFADIVKQKDTIRVYNLHLESLKINPHKENFGQESSEKLLKRLENSFKKQVDQTEKFLTHEQRWKGKKIVCGDFNNTSYSWVYNQIAKNKKDAFIEAGKGFGKTFHYWFPMRIDFILTDETLDINQFKTFSVKYSDHFPIQARINWN